MNNKKTKQVVLSALFAAMVFVVLAVALDKAKAKERLGA